MKEVERARRELFKIQTCNRLETARMESSSAEKDIEVFVGSKLSLQPALTADS